MGFGNLVPYAVILTVAIISKMCAGQTDLTLSPKAKGKDVTEAAYNKVKDVFGDDHRFLIRIAWVESKFGEDQQTFRSGYFGGIWQVDKIGFLDTQDAKRHPQLLSRYKQIKDSFDIDWSSVKWEDLTKPLYSAVAARLLLLNKPKAIPTSVDEQAAYWKTYYNSAAGKGTEQKFIQDVRALESCNANKYKIKCRMDLVVILDGSGSIGSADFVKAKNFVAELVKCISNRYARIGYIVYSSENFIIFPLDNKLNETQLEKEILGATYPGQGTATAAAIDAGANLLGLGQNKLGIEISKKRTAPFPRVMVVLTDGQSDSPDTTSKSAQRAKQNGIISFAIGIGNNYNQLELTNIAGQDPKQTSTISSYSSLADLLYQTRTETCSKPLRPVRHTVVADSVEQSEVSYYAFNVPKEGITISMNVSEGEALAYYSYSVENPTAALNDGTLKNGHNYIPPPPNSVVTHNDTAKSRKKRMAPTTTTSNSGGSNQNETVQEVKSGQVFIAIEGVEPVNNFTIYSEDGGKSIEASDATKIRFDFLFAFSVFVYCL